MTDGLVAFAIGQLFDLLTTAYGYSIDLTDDNPTVRYTIGRYGFVGLLLVKLASILLLSISCLLLRHYSPKAAKIVAWLFAIPQLLVPLWNVYAITR